jgi:hypothetical protein
MEGIKHERSDLERREGDGKNQGKKIVITPFSGKSPDAIRHRSQ